MLIELIEKIAAADLVRELLAYAADLLIEVLPGQGYIEMINHPEALRALQAAFATGN